MTPGVLKLKNRRCHGTTCVDVVCVRDIFDKPSTGKWKMTKVTSDNTIRSYFSSTKRRLPKVKRRPFAAIDAMRNAVLKIRHGNTAPVVVRDCNAVHRRRGAVQPNIFTGRCVRHYEKSSRGIENLRAKCLNKEYSFKRLYRNLYNPEFYLLAYQNIASSQGSMTQGADKMTLTA